MYNKTRCKKEKHFCRFCLQCFSCERILVEHKETCFGKQTVKLRSGSIKFKNYFKQLVVQFNIYANFKLNLSSKELGIVIKNTSYTEKYQAHISCSFTYHVVCIDDKFSKTVVLYREKMQSIGSLKQLLKSIIIAKSHKNIFNKNLVMSLQNMEKSFNQEISARYVINYLM